MLLEDFHAGKKTIPGWKRYGRKETSDAVAKLTSDSKTLYLGKLADNWQPLARADLTKLPNAPVPDAWNRIRIAAKGPRIRVWLNPLHDDPGLQIDFTDKSPILKGAVGLRTHSTTAWFDDVVVLPITDLPEPETIPESP